MTRKNICNRKAAIVPYCMIAPGFQAEAQYGMKRGWSNLFLEILLDNDIDIVPYSCVEATVESLAKGLIREKHGLNYYQTKTSFSDFCDKRAAIEAKKIEEMVGSGYKIVAILGIEHSPSCAVSYLYTNSGTQKRPGIFMEKLMKVLKELGLSVDYIGINRKFPNKAIEKLKECI